MNDAYDNAQTDAEMLKRFGGRTVPDVFAVGDRVMIFNKWFGVVLKVAKTGSVSVTGWRGWIKPENVEHI
jgi:hypothetical protein